MKNALALPAFIAVLLCAVISFAADGADSGRCASCGKCVDVSVFQSASKAIASARPKIWLVQPMKAFDPVEKEHFGFFQKIADRIRPAPACKKAPEISK
jgi:hypothetical protein